MPDQSPGLGPMNEDAGAQPPGRHLFGSLALAWISGGAIVLFAVAISGRLDATGALEPWLWSSPWSLACLALAGTIGLGAASFIGRLRQRELEREFIDWRLRLLRDRVDHELAEARARFQVSQERGNAG